MAFVPFIRGFSSSDFYSVAQVDLFIMKYCNDVLTHHSGGRTVRMDPAFLVPKFKDKKDMANIVSDKFEEIFTAVSIYVCMHA